MVIFHSCVSLPEGIYIYICVCVRLSQGLAAVAVFAAVFASTLVRPAGGIRWSGEDALGLRGRNCRMGWYHLVKWADTRSNYLCCLDLDDHGWWNRNLAKVLLKPLPNPESFEMCIMAARIVSAFSCLVPCFRPAERCQWPSCPGQSKDLGVRFRRRHFLFHGRIHRASPRRKDQWWPFHLSLLMVVWWGWLFEPMPICQPTSRELLKWTSEELVLLYQRICFEICSSTTGKVSR